MTSQQLNQLARAIAYQEKWPTDMSHLIIRFVDFAGEKSFSELAGGLGAESLTEWRALHDRLRSVIKKRGGKITTTRHNALDYRLWLAKYGMKDTRQVRKMYLQLYQRLYPNRRIKQRERSYS